MSTAAVWTERALRGGGALLLAGWTAVTLDARFYGLQQGLRAIVAEGVSGRTLRRAVGHLPGTSLPGAGGNVVLAAHRDTFFRPLKGVQRGDAIRLTTREGRFEYTVEETQVVEPTRTEVLDPAGPPTLTLVTCYPFDLVGSAPDRFIVRAVQTR